jgi:hypothetical protein
MTWTAAGTFSKDLGFDFEARCTVGRAALGVGDVGLALATLDRIGDHRSPHGPDQAEPGSSAGGEPQAWFDEWSATARDLVARADAAVGSGHVQTAGWAYLAAADYFAVALGAVDGLADQSVLKPTFAEHRRCWDGWIDASAGAHVQVEIPYQDTTLPGWLLRPDASGARRPTLVMTNGSDGSLPALVASGAMDALARGWNAFLYDGPGQQSMLVERGVPFRPDWEAVLTPVVDALIARGDVDADALVGYGISQAGYWLPRALAFEHRLVAAVADPGVMDVSTSWLGHLPAELIGLLRSGDKATFNGYMEQMAGDPDAERTFRFRARPYGLAEDPFDVFTEVMAYNLAGVVGQIRTPLLLTDPQDEQFWPGQSQQLFGALTGEKQVLPFAADQGANWHCQPMGRQLTNNLMLDWLADRLAALT